MQLVKHCEPSGEAPVCVLEGKGKSWFYMSKRLPVGYSAVGEDSAPAAQLLVSLWLTATEHALLIAWYSEFSLHFKGTMTQWLPNAGLE